jgi:ribonuclease P protein component
MIDSHDWLSGHGFILPQSEVFSMARFLKTQRLLSKKDFDTALGDNSLKVVCHDFVLVASKSANHGPARLGLIVSGKVGNSVVRNRIKRSVRDVFRNELAMTRELSGRSLVVIARPSLVDSAGHVTVKLRDHLRSCSARLVKKLGSSQ